MLNIKYIYKFLILTIVGTLIFWIISFLTIRQACPFKDVSWLSTGKYYTNPVKVVVEPWKGEHNIYGIFQIPEGYSHQKIFTVTIPKEKTFCGVFVEDNDFAGVQPKPGYYLIKGFFRTRMALRILFRGKGSELKQPQNWKVGYNEGEN